LRGVAEFGEFARVADDVVNEVVGELEDSLWIKVISTGMEAD